MSASTRASLAFALSLLGAAALAPPARAQGEDDGGGCVYEREVYPEGATLCQAGTQKRCEDGAWADVGDCPGGVAPEPPSGGGDAPEPDGD